MISKMLKMQMLEDEDDLAYAETEKKARTDSTSDGRPAWMRTLHTTASNWLHLIPQTLSHLKRTVENIKVARSGRGCAWVSLVLEGLAWSQSSQASAPGSSMRPLAGGLSAQAGEMSPRASGSSHCSFLEPGYGGLRPAAYRVQSKSELRQSHELQARALRPGVPEAPSYPPSSLSSL